MFIARLSWLSPQSLVSTLLGAVNFHTPWKDPLVRHAALAVPAVRLLPPHCLPRRQDVPAAASTARVYALHPTAPPPLPTRVLALPPPLQGGTLDIVTALDYFTSSGMPAK